MKIRTRFAMRLFILISAMIGIGVGTAEAQPPAYSLTGNLRLGYGLGTGLLGVIPYTAAPIPTGRIVATPMATVMEPPGADPRAMIFQPSQLTAPAVPLTVGLFLMNSQLFQANTSAAGQWPKAAATFQAGGRTGAATVVFCPGQVVPPLGNPACVGPQGGSHSGLMRYTKTTNQFGGPGPPNLSGSAAFHLKFAGSPPCDAVGGPGPCTVGLVTLAAPNTVAIGAPFGFSTVAGAGGAAPNVIRVKAAPGGSIVSQTPGFATSPGLFNTATSFGGPWTTGMLTVSITDNQSPPPQIFMLTGNDARVAGVGSISLVAGAVVTRTLTGTAANRGWLNLTVPEPGVGLGTAVALGVLAVLHGLVRRRRLRPR